MVAVSGKIATKSKSKIACVLLFKIKLTVKRSDQIKITPTVMSKLLVLHIQKIDQVSISNVNYTGWAKKTGPFLKVTQSDCFQERLKPKSLIK